MLDLPIAQPPPVRRAARGQAAVTERERAAAGETDDRSPADGDVTPGCDEAVAGELL